MSKEEAIKELEEICDTGKFNMFMDRKAIMQYANNNQMFNLVDYCGNDRYKYLEILKEVNK